MLTGEQIRAARAMLRMEQTALAESADISVETVRRLEKFDGPLVAQEGTLQSIRAAFERAGLILIDDDQRGSVGVRRAIDHYSQMKRQIAEVGHTATMVALESLDLKKDLLQHEPESMADQIHRTSRFLFVKQVADILKHAKK